MPTRRALLRGTAAATTAALAGCGDIAGSGPDPEVRPPELEGCLVDPSEGDAMVTVTVGNNGAGGEVRVTANLVDREGTVIETHTRTVEIPAGETRQLEFEVTPSERAATVSVGATGL